jgi:hypothetical protein
MCRHGCPVLKVTVEVFHALAAMAPQVSAPVGAAALERALVACTEIPHIGFTRDCVGHTGGEGDAAARQAIR